MAKTYDQPVITEIKTPTVETTEEVAPAGAMKIAGVVAQSVPSDLTSIYKERITLFRKFIAGQYAANNLEERGEEQVKFITFFGTMLEAEYPVMSACMDALIKEIIDNPTVMSDEKIRAPYWGMKKKPNEQFTAPYFAFLTFVESLAANLKRRSAFIKGYDVTSLLSHWNEKQKQNLYRYIYD